MCLMALYVSSCIHGRRNGFVSVGGMRLVLISSNAESVRVIDWRYMIL